MTSVPTTMTTRGMGTMAWPTVTMSVATVGWWQHAAAQQDSQRTQ